MSRNKRILNTTFPYHVTSRCINKEAFHLPLDYMWEVYQRHLYFMKMAYEVEIHQFVMMRNHYHLVLSTPKANLSEAMARFNRDTSYELRSPCGRINQYYGSRFFSTVLRTYQYQLHVYKYVYRNPLTAGICKNVHDYPYSTLPGKLGKKHLLIPVEEDLTLFLSPQSCLKWLNTEPDPQDYKDVKTALKKTIFKLRAPKNSLEEHHLEKEAL